MAFAHGYNCFSLSFSFVFFFFRFPPIYHFDFIFPGRDDVGVDMQPGMVFTIEPIITEVLHTFVGLFSVILFIQDVIYIYLFYTFYDLFFFCFQH